MDAAAPPSSPELDALKAALAAAQARADHAEAQLAAATARASDDQARIAHLKLTIAKLQRQLFGTSSERTQRLLDQFELQLEELEASGDRRRAGRGPDHRRCGVRPSPPVPPALPGAPAARACRRARALRLPGLRLSTVR